MSYYAIEAGGQKKIFATWDECQAFRDLYPSGARYKKFGDENSAREYLGLPHTGKPAQRAGAKPHQRPQTGCKRVSIYADGACAGNPGPGGWGAILIYDGVERELSGAEAYTTNNRMELLGVIEALSLLKEPCSVDLYSDSRYVVDALQKGWAKSWRARGWVKSDKTPAKNPDLWERLLELCETHSVRCHWVKGHAENAYNNRCDQLAVAARGRVDFPF